MKIGIDLGGTTVEVGAVENNKVICSFEERTADCKTEQELVAAVLNTTELLIAECGLKSGDIECIGIGCPGETDNINGIAVGAGNLPVDNTPFAALLKEKFKVPTMLDNDANCAAWGEYIAGASKGLSNVVTVTLGTGIGGGIIIDGKMLHGKENHAGEIGHIVVDIHGKRCGCGRIGCWETLASTKALINIVRPEAESAPHSILGKIIASENGNVDGKTLFKALSKGCIVAKSIFEGYIDILAVGMLNIINVFRPDMIVISGGISKEGDTIILPLREAVGNESTLIVAGTLGGKAGVIGAANLLLMNK